MFGVAVHGEMLKGNFGRATGRIAFHGVAGSACLDPTLALPGPRAGSHLSRTASTIEQRLGENTKGRPPLPRTLRETRLPAHHRISPPILTRNRLAESYGGEPLSIQVRKRSTSSAGQRPSQGMLPAASFS
jgi:hypothetical protein